jgi:splicing factor 3A subunit 3
MRGASPNFTTSFKLTPYSYISALLAYLLSFVRRARPLEDVESNRAASEVEFIEQWDGGKLTQWFDNTDGSPSDKPTESIWCAACQKMYSKQTVYDAHLKSRKHIKATEKLVNSNEAPPVNPNGPAESENNASMQASTSRPKYFQAAMDTYLSATLLKSLEATLIDTKANVERRFALTARERELEEQEPQNSAPAPTNAAPEEEEEEERIYNPLKLPLGWDGKPIPYWLYKLHGLGVEYRCEICSDHIYMGR